MRLRLDLVAVIQLAPGGEAQSIAYAHNVPADEGAPPYRAVGPLPIGQTRVDVGRLMAELEAEFARRARAREVRAKDGRAINVMFYLLTVLFIYQFMATQNLSF